MDDPWFVVSQYSATRPGQPPLRVDWLDLPAKFVQQAHAYWTYTGDDTFGAEVYPALVRTMTHLLSRDVDGDGIPDARGWCTTYDAIEMDGVASYVAAFFIGACDAMADFAVVFDTDAAQTTMVRRRRHRRAPRPKPCCGTRAAGTTGSTPTAPSARHCSPTRCAASATARGTGLPDVLDRHRMASHLSQVYRLQRAGVADAQMGATNAVDPAGRPIDTPQGKAVWPGGTYFTAALMHAVGVSTGRHGPRRQCPHHRIRRVPHHLRRRPHGLLVRHPRPVDTRRQSREPGAVPGRRLPAMPRRVGTAGGHQRPVPGGLEALGVTLGPWRRRLPVPRHSRMVITRRRCGS